MVDAGIRSLNCYRYVRDVYRICFNNTKQLFENNFKLYVTTLINVDKQQNAYNIEH